MARISVAPSRPKNRNARLTDKSDRPKLVEVMSLDGFGAQHRSVHSEQQFSECRIILTWIFALAYRRYGRIATGRRDPEHDVVACQSAVGNRKTLRVTNSILSHLFL